MELLRYTIFSFIFLAQIKAGVLPGLSFTKENPDCSLQKNYVYLDKLQKEKVGLGIVRRYIVRCDKKQYKGFLIGDKVRTHYQHLFVVLRDSKIFHMEVFKFEEPAKYRPPRKWLTYFFQGKELKDFAIDSLSGATLTSQSVKKILSKIKEVESL